MVERIAAMAASGNYDAVLVAGDVFDAQTITERSIRRLFNAMQGYGGPWVMIPGNHDAALAESVWTRARRLDVIPDNVHVALQPSVMVFADLGFAVLPAPLTQRQTMSDLTSWFDHAETPTGLLRIGLAHGSVQGILAQDIDSPNPIAPDRAQSARLDYLALGDWHGSKKIDARTWYSGTPEQDRFKSNDAGHVLGVDITGPGASPEVSVHAMGGYQWLSWQHTLDIDSDVDQLLQQLDQVAASSVLELSIRGHIDLAGQQRLQAGLSAAEARLRCLQYDSTDLQLRPTDADIAALQADGYLGDVLAELRTQSDEAQGDTARDALAILADILHELRHDRPAP